MRRNNTMSEKITLEQAKEFCKEKGIEVADEKIEKYIKDKELSLEELGNVSGAGLICDGEYPECPPCPNCGSTDTWTGFDTNNSYIARCRTCGNNWTGWF